jgi:TRAP-type C4-dicarboxylate transport system substrate-binding protein
LPVAAIRIRLGLALLTGAWLGLAAPTVAQPLARAAAPAVAASAAPTTAAAQQGAPEAAAVAPAAGQTRAATPLRLRVVGGLGALNQFTLHERPFWTQQLPLVSGGRLQADIVPFDEAGLSGGDMLRLLQTGAVPFATALLPLASVRDLELAAPDLSGLSPDMAALRRHVAAFRPHLAQRLRERWGVELLAIYTYPAQVTFCQGAFASLADLAGRRIRTANHMQTDLVEAIGAVPVQAAFGDIMPKLRSGDIECAITGTMSGNTIGLHELTTHVHAMAANWGVAVFGANAAAWAAIEPELRTLLRRELAQLEARIWADADRETGAGLACNSGAAGCVGGRPGRMTVVPATPADAERWRVIVVSTVLPRWLRRCGERCTEVWNQTLAPVTGIRAGATPP